MNRIRTAALLIGLIVAGCSEPAPTASSPSGLLRIAPLDGGSVLVAWDDAPASAGGYRLEWSADAGRGTLDLASDVRSAIVAGVSRELDVTLSARNGVDAPAIATTTWLGQYLPESPTAVRAERLGDGTVRVAWDRSSDSTVTGTYIFWSNGTAIGMRKVGLDVTSYDIAGLSADMPVRISLSAVRGVMLSPMAVTTLGDPPSAITGLRASSPSQTSVALMWDAVAGPIDSYLVRWRRDDGADSGSTTVTVPSATIEGLTTGAAYTFSVETRRGTFSSAPVSIAWATATRFTHDASSPTKALRMHESQSEFTSGLILDPALGGPRMASLHPASSDRVQLAMYLTPPVGSRVDEVVVGPAFAIPEYRAVMAPGRIDSTVFISASTYLASSLDDWFVEGPIDALIDPLGNVKAFVFTDTKVGSQGFFVRTGMPGNHHYARVLIKATENGILQGTYPNRYVEVEVSYQTTPNLPYAKRRAPTVGVEARRMR